MIIGTIMLVLAGASALACIAGAIAFVVPLPAIGIPTRERAVAVVCFAAAGAAVFLLLAVAGFMGSLARS